MYCKLWRATVSNSTGRGRRSDLGIGMYRHELRSTNALPPFQRAQQLEEEPPAGWKKCSWDLSANTSLPQS